MLEALGFDHLHHLQFEFCIKYFSGFRITHGSCHFSFNNLSDCLFLLDYHTQAQGYLI